MSATKIAFPKIKRARNLSAIEAARKPYCEYSGKPGYSHVHHIRRRSQGGGDTPENLVSLAPEVHDAVHRGEVDRRVLILIVARRENLAPEEVCARIGEPVPSKWPDYNPPDPPSWEEILQLLLSLEEAQDDCKWHQGEILASLAECGVSQRAVASEIGKSSSYVRERIKTWRAFPEEGTRVRELSWQHHRIAAKTDDPQNWIAKAADNGWSTRDLERAIKEARNPNSALTQEEKELKQAEALFAKLEEVVAKGGPAGKWLLEKTEELLKELGMLKKGVRVSA
ncbi:MAG: HNH endonuclease [Bacillota bacterium]